jgi:DNA-binding transcriptional ArsR family regulator
MQSPVDRRLGYDLASVGEAIGDPSRAAMLVALLGGVALPASELARAARVVPSTATSHLKRLMQAGLVVARAQGRHRYFALSGPRVADAVERLATIDVRVPPRRTSDEAFALARTCYTHFAGRISVAFWARATDREWVRWSDGYETVTLSPKGHEVLARGGLEVDALLSGSACLDWTERTPHVSGRLGVAVCAALLSGRWVTRTQAGRALRVTARGEAGFGALGVRWRAG